MQACESSDSIVDTDVCLQSPSNVFDVGATHLFPVLSEPGLIYSFDNNDSSSAEETKERLPSVAQKPAHEPVKCAPSKNASQGNYEVKYKQLRRQIRDTIFLNAALRDDVAYTDSQLVKAKQERKALLKKIFHYLPMTEAQAMQSAAALKSIAGSFEGKMPPSILDPVNNGSSSRVSPIMPKKKKKKLATKPAAPSESDSSQQLQTSTHESPKPKRRKPGTAMNRKVQPISRDADGQPTFPIVLGSLVVHSLGEIVHEKPGFHSERYLWPIGYCSSRSYPSMIKPDTKVHYTCKIIDNGAEPIFQISADDDADNPIIAATATACHCAVLKRLNHARGKDATNTGSGPEFFGFSHPTIQYLLQCLPHADKCWKYHWVQFELPPNCKDSVAPVTGLTPSSCGSLTDGAFSDNEMSPTTPTPVNPFPATI